MEDKQTDTQKVEMPIFLQSIIAISLLGCFIGIIIFLLNYFVWKTVNIILLILLLLFLVLYIIILLFLWKGYKLARILYLILDIISISLSAYYIIIKNFSMRDTFHLVITIVFFLYILLNKNVKAYCRK